MVKPTAMDDESVDGEVAWIACPHLEASESGWVQAEGAGLVVDLDPGGWVKLILCRICSEVVTAKVLKTTLQQGVVRGVAEGMKGRRW